MKVDAEVDLVGMAIAVYEISKPAGYGYSQQWHKPLTQDQVIGQIYDEQPYLFSIDDEAGLLSMDYVRGRQCKCWMKHWGLNDREFDQGHGSGAGTNLVARVGRRRARKELTVAARSVDDARAQLAA